MCDFQLVQVWKNTRQRGKTHLNAGGFARYCVLSCQKARNIVLQTFQPAPGREWGTLGLTRYKQKL
jgi:hypothetical protein